MSDVRGCIRHSHETEQHNVNVQTSVSNPIYICLQDLKDKYYIKLFDITSKSKSNVQGKDITTGESNCLQDHTDGHDIKLFAEQLTRTFEGIVF